MSERRERIRETGERRKSGSEKDFVGFSFVVSETRERERKKRDEIRDSGFGVSSRMEIRKWAGFRGVSFVELRNEFLSMLELACRNPFEFIIRSFVA